MERTHNALGDRALWGKVGYTGEAHAPASGTYLGVDAMTLNYTTQADSGTYARPGGTEDLANLVPLVMASLYECGFAWEAGPLTTWNN